MPVISSCQERDLNVLYAVRKVAQGTPDRGVLDRVLLGTLAYTLVCPTLLPVHVELAS